MREASSLSAAARLLQLVAARPADLGPGNPLFRLERALGVAQVREEEERQGREAADGVAQVE